MILILGIVVALIVLALVVTVFSVIVALLEAAVVLVVAALAGAAAAMLATAIGQAADVAEPGLLAAPVGIGVFLVVAALLLRRMFGKRVGAGRPAWKVHETSSLSEPVERDVEVRAAWIRARDLVPRAALAEVARARADCAALLDMADGNTLDAGVIDLAALIRRNVPALVRQVDALWRTAARAERGELGQGLADDLVRLDTAARPFVDRHRESLRDGLAAIRNHVAARTG